MSLPNTTDNIISRWTQIHDPSGKVTHCIDTMDPTWMYKYDETASEPDVDIISTDEASLLATEADQRRAIIHLYDMDYVSWSQRWNFSAIETEEKRLRANIYHEGMSLFSCIDSFEQSVRCDIQAEYLETLATLKLRFMSTRHIHSYHRRQQSTWSMYMQTCIDLKLRCMSQLETYKRDKILTLESASYRRYIIKRQEHGLKIMEKEHKQKENTLLDLRIKQNNDTPADRMKVHGKPSVVTDYTQRDLVLAAYISNSDTPMYTSSIPIYDINDKDSVQLFIATLVIWFKIVKYSKKVKENDLKRTTPFNMLNEISYVLYKTYYANVAIDVKDVSCVICTVEERAVFVENLAIALSNAIYTMAHDGLNGCKILYEYACTIPSFDQDLLSYNMYHTSNLRGLEMARALYMYSNKALLDRRISRIKKGLKPVGLYSPTARKILPSPDVSM